MIDARFMIHNSHREGVSGFHDRDPQLRHLAACSLRYRSPLLDILSNQTPGIHTLGGGRQTGKSTLLKQWMSELINHGTPPESITYLNGELIDDHHSLLMHMQNHLDSAPADLINTLIVDEVTYIRDWDKAIKYAADAGLLEHTEVMITGSDLAFIREARMRFPRRRGASPGDFHLHPLSFREYVSLTGAIEHPDDLPQGNAETINSKVMDCLYESFDRYLLHGGYLIAINDLERHGQIRRSTLATYADRIRGDVVKRGKQEAYLREILSAVIRHYGSQITWNAMAQDLSIDHPKTIANYVALLDRMDALCVIPAIREDRLAAAPKKAKKVFFRDPFILYALRAWLYPSEATFKAQIQSATADSVWVSRIVEATVASHCQRIHPTFYIKAQTEVDVAYVHQNRFWPIEIKWTNQLRPKTLKQIARYDNGEIWSKSRVFSEINSVNVAPLPLRLLRF
ncbi:MAG: ATP-binding protein [Gammaproteobacteria bacterium]|nr:ATP-binding protein [Gammaproteobacteria bacterium]